jgi:hypothetical protein
METLDPVLMVVPWVTAVPTLMGQCVLPSQNHHLSTICGIRRALDTKDGTTIATPYLKTMDPDTLTVALFLTHGDALKEYMATKLTRKQAHSWVAMQTTDVRLDFTPHYSTGGDDDDGSGNTVVVVGADPGDAVHGSESQVALSVIRDELDTERSLELRRAIHYLTKSMASSPNAKDTNTTTVDLPDTFAVSDMWLVVPFSTGSHATIPRLFDRLVIQWLRVVLRKHRPPVTAPGGVSIPASAPEASNKRRRVASNSGPRKACVPKHDTVVVVVGSGGDPGPTPPVITEEVCGTITVATSTAANTTTTATATGIEVNNVACVPVPGDPTRFSIRMDLQLTVGTNTVTVTS